MIDLVFMGHCWEPNGSEELRFGWEILQRDLPQTQLERTEAKNFLELWTCARHCILARPDMRDEARVLLLKHAHVMLAPDCLAHLEAAMDLVCKDRLVQVDLVQGFDSGHPPQGTPVDYATWRGMERYAASLKNDVVQSAYDNARLLSLSTVGALRRHSTPDTLSTSHACSAFGHDFSGYHSGKREEMIPLIPQQSRCVLDVGGGAGGFLQALQAERHCETHLAEYSPQACAAAEGHVDRIWQGDFLTQEIDQRFDCITFLDVLEHIENPLIWLKRATSLLAPDGCVVASIPNVGHWSVVADLLEGRWDYAPVGIHCITHLRFFTRHGIQALFAQADLAIEHVESTRLPAPPWWRTPNMDGKLAVDEDSLSSYAFLVRARPKGTQAS